MSTALTKAIVENANSSIDAYVTTATQLFSNLEQTINNLTSSDFIGAASNGYKVFFTKKIQPALTTQLTDPGASLTATLKSMMDQIKTNLLDTVDENLGKENENLA